MEDVWDAIVVGAGPAGCAAAFDLAVAGQRVLLLDRRSFPRHKACACGLTRKTLKALRYSVEPVIERVCRDVVLQEAGPGFGSGARAAVKDFEVRVRTRAPFCSMAVRERFDDFCLKQTREAGARFRKIEGISTLRETPTNIELEIVSSDGESERLQAPVVIGADGSNGQMRRLSAGLYHPGRNAGTSQNDSISAAAETYASSLPAEPEWYARGFALEATVAFTELPTELPGGEKVLDLVFDFSPISGGYGWLFPKGDHVNIGVGGFVPQARMTGPASNEDAPRETSGMLYENATRALLAEYALAKLGVSLPANVTGQYLGLGGHDYQPQGRVLLTGDAAGLIDPLTGEGIHSAVVSGQAAAAAILLCAGRGSIGTAGSGADLARAYAERLAPLQETLRFSHRAAKSFYREPGRGFKVMRTPLLRNLVLKTYADGLPVTDLLTRLARRVA